jgi:hypothetical protein
MSGDLELRHDGVLVGRDAVWFFRTVPGSLRDREAGSAET